MSVLRSIGGPDHHGRIGRDGGGRAPAAQRTHSDCRDIGNRHFVAQGRRQLAFVGGSDPRATRRWHGFRDHAVAEGLSEPRRLILERNTTSIMVAHAKLLGRWFTANDAYAIGLMAGLRQAGRLREGRASEQPVAVIGIGDLESGRLLSPTMSTIGVHGDAIGRTAATLTLNRGGERQVDLGFDLSCVTADRTARLVFLRPALVSLDRRQHHGAGLAEFLGFGGVAEAPPQPRHREFSREGVTHVGEPHDLCEDERGGCLTSERAAQQCRHRDVGVKIDAVNRHHRQGRRDGGIGVTIQGSPEFGIRTKHVDVTQRLADLRALPVTKDMRGQPAPPGQRRAVIRGERPGRSCCESPRLIFERGKGHSGAVLTGAVAAIPADPARSLSVAPRGLVHVLHTDFLSLTTSSR
ncbi:substrate-binding domain-containing protein [Bradyrhizobium diazoefficiens]|nr:substrate-binding domain-containing protein [Bradyrhizobium diazoefficiens]